MAVFTRYTSASCNRCPNIADWGTNNLICYGYSNAVALYERESSHSTCGVVSTASFHSERVNCVAWITNFEGETEFVSGSADHTINVWQVVDKKILPQPLCTLRGHTGSVTCVSGVNIPQEKNKSTDQTEALIFSASIDSTVKIWSKLDKEAKEVQTVCYGEGFSLSVASCIVPETNVPVLASGCDDQKVHLYARQDDGKFKQVITLFGHEDWVRGLHFTFTGSGDILLASCAQDNLIRVWRLIHKTGKELISNSEKVISKMPPEEDITVKETLFSFINKGHTVCFAVSLESVLSGHENWVYSVKWSPLSKDLQTQSLKLLSASMDKTLILWSPDPDSGIWTEEMRVGDVGGNTLGFYGGLFSPCGQSILGHGYQGAFNQWIYDKNSSTWQPEVTGGGHFAPVVDLAWSGGGGDYLLSASVDQTTRLHASWIHGEGRVTWCEVARPQVHGYDLKCLAMLGKYSFASGADEKLIRVFTSPRNFITNFCQICNHDINKELNGEQNKSLPEGANVPALGLSNKAVFSGDLNAEAEKEESTRPGQYPENYFSPADLKVPPSEDQLLQNTLWPEEGKLYGHGYEIFSLAAHPSGKILASACKAAKADAANILLWDMETKKIIGSLSGCTLTVTQMAFNHQGNKLLAVSRDRTWTLYHETTPKQYTIEASVSKRTSSHSRIIWSCAWTHDDNFFVTASRDKTVCVWCAKTLAQQNAECAPKPVTTIALPDSVTAVSTAPILFNNYRYMVACGLDNGQIHVYLWSAAGSYEWTPLISLSESEGHHLTVTRLAFRPKLGRLGHKGEADHLQLASCGSDHCVRVYDISLVENSLQALNVT